MKFSNKQAEFLHYIEKNNVSFTVRVPSQGHTNISASDVELFVNDPLTFLSSRYAVSNSVYLEWLYFQQTQCRCYGITKKGERCVNMAKDGLKIHHPKDFTKNHSSIFCKIHQEHTGEVFEFSSSDVDLNHLLKN